MPIVAKSVLQARRAAAIAAAARDEEPIPSAQEDPVNSGRHMAAADQRPELNDTELPPDRAPSKRRGHAIKDENGKWQPTDNYDTGFARPPEHSRFKPGGKPGPGRPKGSLSHDALLAKHLSQKREVSVGGRRQRLPAREILVMTLVKSALEGKDKHARTYALAQLERLYPSKETNQDIVSASTLSSSDALSLAEYEEELRERLRAELAAERGASGGEGR